MTSLFNPELVRAVYGPPPSRRRRFIITAIGVSAALLISGLVAFAVVSQREPTCRVGPEATPTCGVWWGAALPGANSAMPATVQANEASTGRRLDIVHTYHRWFETFPTPAEVRLARQGRQLYLNWEPVNQTGQAVTWAAIGEGKQDHQIDVQAKLFKDVKAPILVSFSHEPELNYGKTGLRMGDAADFVAAFRHVVDRMRKDGVSNVSWVWNVVGLTTDPWPDRYVEMWPGNKYVDWVAWDPYNWAGCDQVKLRGNQTWQTFDQRVRPFYDYLQKRGFGAKPFMLGEYGTVEDEDDPAGKADWFAGIPEAMTTMPNLRALLYFDFPTPKGNCDWYVNSTPAAAAGYKSLAHAPLFNESARIRLPVVK